MLLCWTVNLTLINSNGPHVAIEIADLGYLVGILLWAD